MHKGIKYIVIGLIAGFAVGGFFAYANASFNEQINYQGKLTTTTGVAVPDGDYCMKFSVYDTSCTNAPCSGEELWSETWNSSNEKVTVVSGLFSVLLGSHTPFTNIFNNPSRYLQVQFDPNASCTTGSFTETFLPRKQLGAVPAAFQANQLEGLTWEAPGAIGSTTPATGSFTALSASGLFTTSNGSILSSASGVLTLGGSGGTNHENLTLDFESTSNEVKIGSSTGVTSINFSGLNLATTGTLQAGAITGTSFTIGANTISDFSKLYTLSNLSSVSNLSTLAGLSSVSNLSTLAGLSSISNLTNFAGLTSSAGFLANNGAGLLSWTTAMTNPMTDVGDIIFGGDSGNPEKLSAGTTGQILQTNTSASPTWSVATYPSTTTANQILYSSSTNTVAGTSGLTFDGTNGLQVVGSGDSQIISSSGALIFGSNKTSGYDGNLKIDFEVTTGSANFTDGGGTNQITNLDFGTLNLNVGGYISGSPIITSVVSSITLGSACTDGSMKIVSGSSSGIYYCYSGVWHYAADTGGFQIPASETTDPISGDPIKEGDFVVGMVNKTFDDNALHGIWVKASSIKDELLTQLQVNGSAGNGTVSGVNTTTLTDKVTNVLASLGISIKSGITSISQLAVEKSTTNIARINKIEMVDSSTGDIYCTWIQDGVWQKVKGDCASLATANVSSQPAPQENTNQESSNPSPSPTPTLNISSIPSISDINVDFGASLASANLPATVSATLSDSSNEDMAIVWDNGTPVYDANTTGIYAFSGNLTLPENVTNTNNLKAVANVIVASPSPTPLPVEEITPAVSTNTETPQENPASVTGDLIQSAASSLLNGFWNFIKWLFSIPKKILGSLASKTTASLSGNSVLMKMMSDDVKFLSDGLIKPISNLFKN